MGKHALGLGALALLLAACGGTAGSQAGGPATPSPVPARTPGTAPTPVASPTPTPTGANIDGCVTEETGKIFDYKRGGTTTKGVIMGKGPVGVVVSYEHQGSVCGWLPLADRLVAAGHRVLLFDRNNTAAPEEDTVAMAQRLRKAGATKVVLVGGSMGGRLSLLAAGKLDFPVAALISVSGTIQPGEVDDLRAPFLQVTGDADPDASVDMLQTVYNEAVKSADRQMLVLPGQAHASELFAGDQGEKALRAVTSFVEKHTG
ncbi:alpha/beta hydrolase [Streptosporangium roseum]|uniref:alpha/beta hydrolase n=1 Tax=Streptosporangium roseum TaxID=2001 RepID=UPI003327294F